MEGAARIAAKASVLFCAAAIVLLAHPATAAELATLRNGFSPIPHDHHLVMGVTTRLFTSVDDSSFIDVPTEEITGFEKELVIPEAVTPPAAVPSASASARIAAATPGLAKTGLAKTGPAKPAPPLNEVAVSPKGARGLMQLMPGTASQLGVQDSFDPEANVAGGSRYLRELLERYNFDLVKALAAYNAGTRRVEQYNGVPPYRETHNYVARIVHEYNKKKTAQEKAAKQKAAPAKSSNQAHSAPKPPAATIAADSSR